MVKGEQISRGCAEGARSAVTRRRPGSPLKCLRPPCYDSASKSFQSQMENEEAARASVVIMASGLAIIYKEKFKHMKLFLIKTNDGDNSCGYSADFVCGANTQVTGAFLFSYF